MGHDGEQEPSGTRAGHRLVAHTADLMIDAWAPSRMRCLEEAVAALVSAFASPLDTARAEQIEVSFGPVADDDLLVSVLEEVIYITEVRSAVPIAVSLSEASDGTVTGTFRLVPVEQVDLVGAVPKAVSLHQLSFTREGDRWRCRAVIDV